MTQTIEVEVRSYELDSYNHVNNAVYLNYLEYARMEFCGVSILITQACLMPAIWYM